MKGLLVLVQKGTKRHNVHVWIPATNKNTATVFHFTLKTFTKKKKVRWHEIGDLAVKSKGSGLGGGQISTRGDGD